MIVRRISDGSLLLINQTDHCLLFGRFAAHWGNARFAEPRPYESVVRAAAYYDCGDDIQQRPEPSGVDCFVCLYGPEGLPSAGAH